MKTFFSRRSLFVKIFLWFWLAFLLVNAVFLLVSYVTQTDLIPARLRALTVKSQARAAAELFERNGAQVAADYLQQTEAETGIRAFFFDSNGVELTGKQAPEVVRSVFESAFVSDEMQSESRGMRTYSAWRVTTAAAGNSNFVLVAEMPRFPDSSVLTAPLPVRAWRFSLIIIASGLICFWLARYLTKPLVKLNQATRRLAQGDLSVRVGSEFARRQDELADLSRDFDRMAERLETAQDAQKRLLADISHELRSPLARLSIALELARDGGGGSDAAETAESFDVIKREAERMNEMIGQLLTLTRLENNSAEAIFETVDLAQIAEKIAREANFEARNTGRKVTIGATQKCLVNGNAQLLCSAVENVVRNAVRYTAEETAVEISLVCKERNGEQIAVITVRDRGAGVPENELENIFRPFYRVAAGRERESGGTGLGLAIAARAAQLHNGFITAKNASNGGLEVQILLATFSERDVGDNSEAPH